MCGSIGIFRRFPGTEPVLAEADIDRLPHRGPDGRGRYDDDRASLGHRRLAVIDLTDTGTQPRPFGGDRLVVTFNGEICNYLELKRELEKRGERFSGTSDTEVLLAAYKAWGKECVGHLRGAFAFAPYDGRLVEEGFIDEWKVRRFMNDRTSVHHGLFFAYKLVLLECWCRAVWRNEPL